MTDLTEAILAAIDTTEQAAQADLVADGALHARRQRATTTLRRCAADRKILAEHAPADFTAYGDQLCRRCRLNDDETEPDALHHWVVWPCPTLTALAEGYGISEETTN